MAIGFWNYRAELLEMNMTTVVVFPKNIGEDKIPCLFLLHTDGSSPMEVVRRYDIETLSERLHMAVVLPTGHRSCFCNLEYGAAYNDYLTQELLQKVRITFGCISERREDTFICGMGTGEKGVYEALKKHPELFAGGENGTHTDG